MCYIGYLIVCDKDKEMFCLIPQCVGEKYLASQILPFFSIIPILLHSLLFSFTAFTTFCVSLFIGNSG